MSFAWLGQLIDLLRSVAWPFYIVEAPNRGCKFTRGRPGPILQPDWYFCFPFFQRLYSVSMAADYADLPNMGLTTADDESVYASANIGFHVTDPVQYWTQVQDFHNSLAREACGLLSKCVRSRKWPEILIDQARIERRIKHALNRRVTAWGVTVDTVRLTDLMRRVKPIRLIN